MFKKLVFCIAVSSFLFSCGGGGGGGSTYSSGAPAGVGNQTSYTSNAPQNQVSQNTQQEGNTVSQTSNTKNVSGIIVDDFVINATVRAYDTLNGKVIASTLSGENGTFSLKLPANEVVLIEAEGGVLDKDGNPETKYDQANFKGSLLAVSEGAQNEVLVISPVSTSVVAQAVGAKTSDVINGKIKVSQIINKFNFQKIKQIESKIPDALKFSVQNEELALNIAKGISKAIEKFGLDKFLNSIESGNFTDVETFVLNNSTEENISSNQTFSEYSYSVGSSGGSTTTANSQSNNQKVFKNLTSIISVSDENQLPVEGAVVTTKAGNYEISVQTDSNGRAVINWPENLETTQISISAEKPGYRKAELSLDSSQIPQVISLSMSSDVYTEIVNSTTTITRGENLRAFRAVTNNLTMTLTLGGGNYFLNFAPVYDFANVTIPNFETEDGKIISPLALLYLQFKNLQTGNYTGANINVSQKLVCPQDSSTITDFDKNEQGIQVPVYITENGKWKFFEYAKLNNDDGVCNDNTYATFQIPQDITLSGIYFAVGIPKTPKCLYLKLSSSENKPVAGTFVSSVVFTKSLPDGIMLTGATDNNGVFKIKVPYDSQNAIVKYWDPYISKWEDIQTSQFSCTVPQTVEVFKPTVCYVHGTVTGKRIPPVIVGNGTLLTTDFDTDSGEFKAQVPCNQDLNLKIGDKTWKFNVNGEIDGNESYDSGVDAVVNPHVPNILPILTVWTDENIVRKGDKLNLHIYTRDLDKDYPLNVSVKWGSEEQSYPVGENSSKVKSIPIDTSLQNEGNLTFSVSVTDSMGGTTTQNYTVNVLPPNSKPVVRMKLKSRGRYIFILAGAFDVDGNLKTCNIDIPAGLTVVSQKSYTSKFKCKIFKLLKANPGTYTITFNATDESNETSSVPEPVEIIDMEPKVYLYVDKTWNVENGNILHIAGEIIDDDNFTQNDIELYKEYGEGGVTKEIPFNLEKKASQYLYAGKIDANCTVEEGDPTKFLICLEKDSQKKCVWIYKLPEIQFPGLK